jgi:hypothetical protein
MATNGSHPTAMPCATGITCSIARSGPASLSNSSNAVQVFDYSKSHPLLLPHIDLVGPVG